jgi:uncharacterized OsmC-like protein
MMEIKIPPVSVKAVFNNKTGYVDVEARGVTYSITELPEHGGKGDTLTPLEAFIAGLASCEAIMARMIAAQMGLKEIEVIRVDADAEFGIGEGLKRLHVRYVFSGVDRDRAEAIVDLVKKMCPIYNTLSKVINVKDEIIVE